GRGTREKNGTAGKWWDHGKGWGISPGRSRLSLFSGLSRFLSRLTLFAFLCASCRQDMQDQPKYKPLAPSRFFSDGKSARELVEGTAPYNPEGKATPPMADLSKVKTLPIALTPQALDRGQER